MISIQNNVQLFQKCYTNPVTPRFPPQPKSQGRLFQTPCRPVRRCVPATCNINASLQIQQVSSLVQRQRMRRAWHSSILTRTDAVVEALHVHARFCLSMLQISHPVLWLAVQPAIWQRHPHARAKCDCRVQSWTTERITHFPPRYPVREEQSPAPCCPMSSARADLRIGKLTGNTSKTISFSVHPMRRIFALAAFSATAFSIPRPNPGFASQSPLSGTQRHDGSGPLQFCSDGTFHISIFEDLHLGESECRDRLTLLGTALT